MPCWMVIMIREFVLLYFYYPPVGEWRGRGNVYNANKMMLFEFGYDASHVIDVLIEF
jgi:hypothetical protein